MGTECSNYGGREGRGREIRGKEATWGLTLKCEDNIKVNAQRKMGVARSDVNIKIRGSFCERGNALPVSTKCGEFVD